MSFGTIATKPRPKRAKPAHKLDPAVSAEVFKCGPYACALTRAGCARRFVQANKPQPAKSRGPVLSASSCTYCEVGKAHFLGQVPGEAPAITTPATPDGHAPPVRLHVIGDAPAFETNVARSASSAKDRRAANAPRKRAPVPYNRETYLKYRKAKPCKCGKPKPVKKGAQLCEECSAAYWAKRKAEAREREAARRSAQKGQAA